MRERGPASCAMPALYMCGLWESEASATGSATEAAAEATATGSATAGASEAAALSATVAAVAAHAEESALTASEEVHAIDDVEHGVVGNGVVLGIAAL